MPHPDKVRKHKHMRIFGNLLHDPNLLHLNRRSVSGAFAVGLFCAWMPIPMQMVVAAAAAIYFRVNLVISVPLVWISNPLTMPPMFYFAYRLGTWILGTEPGQFKFTLSLEWLGNSLSNYGPAFLLGCLIMAIISSAIGYITIRLLWRWHVISQWEAKKKKYRMKQGNRN